MKELPSFCLVSFVCFALYGGEGKGLVFCDSWLSSYSWVFWGWSGLDKRTGPKTPGGK